MTITTMVGPVVGSISAALGASSASLIDDGAGYDVAIGGIGFRLAINDERPYERATAQFRKEQYDTSENVGDQSLVGFWTKGQLSFHGGGGARYADITGQAGGTDNRYWQSSGVNPFVKGEVTLYPGWGNLLTSTPTSITDCQPLDDTWFAVLANSKAVIGFPGAAGTTYPTSGTVRALAAGGGFFFCAMGDNTIHRVTTAGVGTSIYSHTSALTEMHFAKDRLFVMDDTGTWYQLAPSPSGALPVAIGAADKVFGVSTSGDWSVTDTSGPVLLANGSRVFAATQNDTDGLFPTLGAPIQVAELPIGESVVGMTYYLGFVVMVTTRGVRVAVLGNNGLTYGPRLVEWSGAPARTTLARGGESVYVAGEHRAIEINLASQLGDTLEFGRADLPATFTSQTSYGLAQLAGKVVAWGDSLLQVQQATPVASGALETSYHRFGTLEPKRYHTVKVRMGGTAGSITIAKVDRNGSEVPLHTAEATDMEVEVTLRESVPTDRLALKFTLTASGGVSPELLSYQLRALPAPKRQRMIRIPLVLHDVERRGVTRAKGYEGAAWDRLRQLEDLEDSGGVVMFQDFRTGESGSCYIEQIAHEGKTPPSRQADGFGGLVWITLRRL